MYKYNIGNATHVGQVRKANEDYFGNFSTPNGHVFVVCDGMGGHVGGAKASRIAVEAIKTFLNTNHFTDPTSAIQHAIVNANNAILGYAVQNPSLKGMGATCVLMIVTNQGIFIGHVGDSRIYHFSGSKLYRLTKDHSFVQSLVDLGEITELQAEKHPRKNEISNALGLQQMKPPTVCEEPIPVEKDDILLLCTDGLTGIVNDKGIAQVLKSEKSIQAKADLLVASANQGGGHDNITVQLVEITEAPKSHLHKPSKARLGKALAIAVSVLIVVLAGVYFYPMIKQEQRTATVPESEEVNTATPQEVSVGKNTTEEDASNGQGVASAQPNSTGQHETQLPLPQEQDTNKTKPVGSNLFKKQAAPNSTEPPVAPTKVEEKKDAPKKE